MSAPQVKGIKQLSTGYRDDPTTRIAIALETLAGCTGWLDPETGQRQHDGDTCPVHEGQDDPPTFQVETPLTTFDRLRFWKWFQI